MNQQVSARKDWVFCAIIMCVAAVAMADTWTWSGDNTNDNKWVTCDNWGSEACTKIVGYPSTTNDDVTFSTDETIEIITEQIDDMLFEYDITFHGASGATLTADSFSMVAPCEGNCGSVTTVLTVSGGAEFVADGSGL